MRDQNSDTLQFVYGVNFHLILLNDESRFRLVKYGQTIIT